MRQKSWSVSENCWVDNVLDSEGKVLDNVLDNVMDNVMDNVLDNE